MRKIMLVIDEFNELQFLESLLRRLGFDVLSLSKDLSVASSILGFFPDLVMAQAKSRAVDGLALSQKIRRLAPQARMVLLHTPGQIPKLTAESKNTVDAFLETPVETSKLVAMIAQLANIDPNILTEKVNRIASGQMSEERRMRLQGKGFSSGQQSDSQMVSSTVKQQQSDMVHVISKNPTGKGGTNNFGGASQNDSVSKSASSTNGAFEQGVHHFHGTNKLKGSTHISGDRAQGGAAYDPTGHQSSGIGQTGAAYVPTEQQSGITQNAKGSYPSGESTERTRRYDEFLKAHDEPVDKVLSQTELKKRAKEYKLENSNSESEINQKRQFVRALFRK